MKPEEQIRDNMLPIEKFGNIKWSTIVYLLLSVLSPILILNMILVLYFVEQDVYLGHAIVRHKWQLISDMPNQESIDYLVLGDSSANQAFNPEVVEALGLHGLNLATIGTFGFVDDLWLLETYLATYGTPKAVIVIHSYDVPQREIPSLDLLGTYPIPLNPSIIKSESNQLGEIGTILSVNQRKFFPLFYRNESIRHLIDQLWRGNITLLTDGVDSSFNTFGFMPWIEERNVDLDQSIAKIDQQIALGKLSGKFSAVNLRAIEKMSSLASAYDFELYFVNGTTYDELETAISNVRAELDMQYEMIAKANTNTFYLPNIFTFPREAMDLLDHIRSDYAQQYTEAVMRLILVNSKLRK